MLERKNNPIKNAAPNCQLDDLSLYTVIESTNFIKLSYW